VHNPAPNQEQHKRKRSAVISHPIDENPTKGGVQQMTGRNSKPKNDGPSSSPERLDQYGDKLASENEEEFTSAAEEHCRDQE